MHKFAYRSFRLIIALPWIYFTALQLLFTHNCLESAPGALEMHRPQFVLFGDSLTQHSFDEGEYATLNTSCSPTLFLRIIQGSSITQGTSY
jgi:hypothetical protein